MKKPKQEILNFNGPTRTLALDGKRLGKQLATVKVVMESGEWLTLAQIAMRGQIRISAAASISARLRDLRRMGYTVDRRRLGEATLGLWEYRLGGDAAKQTEAA